MAQNRDKPFFIAAGFHKPHQPWVAPAEFFEQHPLDQIQLPPQREGDTVDIPAPASDVSEFDARLSQDQKKQAIAAYHATVTMTDTYVGELMQALEDLGLAEVHYRGVHKRSRVSAKRTRWAVAKKCPV